LNGFRRFLQKFGGGMGLPGRLLAILLLVATIDFVANSIVLDRANDFALREDDAARMAEHLTIAYRVIERTPPANRSVVARELSTERFSIRWSAQPDALPTTVSLTRLRAQVLAFEPDLGKVDLRMHLLPLRGQGDIGGSMTLSDRSYLTFRTFSRSAWTLNLGRVGQTVLPTALLALLAWFLFRTTLRPLATLVQATRRVGSAQPQSLPETGPAEVRELIHAFNAMQLRIHELLARGSQTLLAIGHDLRTPLARLQLRLDNAGIDPAAHQEMSRDIDEMRDLLASLQAFVESGDDRTAQQRIDVAAMVQTLVDAASDRGADAVYTGPDSLDMVARPVAVRRSVSNLIENALHYGGNVRVAVRDRGDLIEIEVADDGPGIPDDQLEEVLQPFVRLDNARSRDTPGMGLGLPIVHRAIRSENGRLHLRNAPQGGLRATIRLPRVPD